MGAPHPHTQIDVEDESCVKEDEMCSYLLQQFQERDTLAYTHPLPFQQPPSFRHNPNSKVNAPLVLCH